MSVKCGNKTCPAENRHHETVADVRACFGQGPRTLDSVAAGQPLRVAPQRPVTTIPVQGTLHKGTFTVVFADNSRRTIKIRRQNKNANFRPGVMLVKYLSGPNNENDYTAFGEVVEENGRLVAVKIWKRYQDKAMIVEAVKVLCQDPQAAAKAYAQESDRCANCNHELTVPQGPKKENLNPYRDAGYGPDCGEEIFGGSVAA
jgi:hypothetical protein